MEAFLDGLLLFVAAIGWTNPAGQALTWILGDWQSVNESGLPLPLGIVTPGVKQTKALSGGNHGIDMQTYTVPIWIVNGLEQNAAPVPIAGTNPVVYESPDYRTLVQATEATVAALRADIEVASVAISNVQKEEYGRLPMEGGTTYRAARFVLVASKRVAR